MIYDEPLADVSFFAQVVGSSNNNDWESDIDPDITTGD